MFKLAIVGAPNVGKSTLFNKLLGGRRAIVDDQPGVTRDRLYATVNLERFAAENGALPLCLIDTGGLFFAEDRLHEGINQQVRWAMEEADCILLVTNGRSGITSTDQQIATILLRQKKPVILLVNKLDSPELHSLSAEFYRLGLGDPLAFSSFGSTFGGGMQALIDRLKELGLGREAEEVSSTDRDLPKFVLLGRPNVGKSSLLNCLVGYQRSLVHDQAGTTSDALDTYLEYCGQSLMLIDTAGLRRKSKVYGDLERYSVDRAIKGLVRADVAILVIDALEGISHQEERLASLIQKRHKGCLLVLNKWDLVTEKDYNHQVKQIRQELGFLGHTPVVISSAQTGQRTGQILEQALQVHQNLHRRISTSVLNQVLGELASLRKVDSRLKVYYATQTGVNPPTFCLFVNDPKHLSKNYLKYLENNLRAEFGFEGVSFQWNFRKAK